MKTATTLEPTKHRVWEATLRTWMEIARELKQDRTHDEIVNRVHNFVGNDPNSPLRIVVDLDDCASLRELIADLGLTEEMCDSTEPVEEVGAGAVLSMAVELGKQAEAWGRLAQDLENRIDRASLETIKQQIRKAQQAIPVALRGLVL